MLRFVPRNVPYVLGAMGLASTGMAVCDPHTAATTAQNIADAEKHRAFSPKEFRSFTIKEVKDLSPNTKLYNVALPTAHHEMGMQTASFVMVKGPPDAEGKATMRPYTPTSTNEHKGSFELVIKAYPNGVVSSYLHTLQPGDSIEVKGPIMKFKYTPNSKKHIGMLAGGSGITPMLQVIEEIVQNPHDKTQVDLIFANNMEIDILLKDRLDAIAKKHKNIRVHYVLSQVQHPDQWKGYTGFVSEELVRRHIHAPSADTLVLVCGPPGFMEAVSGGKTPDYQQGEVSGILKTIGYNSSMVFKF